MKNNYLIPRRRYQCRFRSAFSNKTLPTVKNFAIFSDFWRILESKVTLLAKWRYHLRLRKAFSNKMSPYT